MSSHESAAQLHLVTAHLLIIKGLGLKVVLLGNATSFKRTDQTAGQPRLPADGLRRTRQFVEMFLWHF